MAISEALIREQLPPGAQKSGSSKEVTGVIDENLQTDGDILRNQALSIARARQGVTYETGAEFSDAFIERVKQNNVPNRYVNQRMTQDTINAISLGSQERTQAYVGSNADWTGYYLEPLAKYVVPFDCPFRNMLPRTMSVGIDVENWRAITDVWGGNGPSVGSFILPQLTAPQVANYNWVNKSNVLRQLAWSDVITFESELYGRMFEPDVRAKVAARLSPSLMLGQETWYLNAAQYLWAPPTPNAPSTSGSGGTLAANTYWIVVTALNIAFGGGVGTGETLAFGGSTPVAISQVTVGSTSTISFNINRVPNAYAYNVYVGTGNTQPANSALFLQGASAHFGGATALNDPGGLAQGWMTVTLSSYTGSGTAYSTVVTAGNTAIAFTSGGSGTPVNEPLAFDGIQSLVYLNSGTLSTVGAGGETAAVKRVADVGGVLAKSDIDNWLEAMYLNARANPEALLVPIKDHKAISNIVANGSSFRIITQPTQAGLSDLVGGARATKWLNQTTGRLMDIIMCPYLMQGTIVAVSLQLPFQVAEIDKPPLRVSVNREMWAMEYPPSQGYMTQWAYAAYTSETLVAQYLGGQGVLTGIVTQ